MLRRELAAPCFIAPHTGTQQPFLQDANAAEGTLIQKVPDGHEIRFGLGKWQLLLEGEQRCEIPIGLGQNRPDIVGSVDLYCAGLFGRSDHES